MLPMQRSDGVSSNSLVIRNLHAGVNGQEILNGLDLQIRPGEIHALMGPNGSGKSTLASVLMGNPRFVVSNGRIELNGKSVLGMTPDQRARLGLFLSFQYPFEVPGLSMGKFLFHAYQARFPNEKISPLQFRQKLNAVLAELRMDPSFGGRDLNVGFSGGEKKRCEILQLRLLNPSLAVLDETDSGLDIDSLKLVAETVNKMRSKEFSCLVITHYQRILDYLKPDFVHVLYNGKMVVSGGPELAEELEGKGYRQLFQEKGIAVPAVLEE
jgi:Fe-S cluster assembly ATP-binding protein